MKKRTSLKRKKHRPTREKDVIGWREWVGLPDLHIKRIKAKVDTGARSSSLHAYDLLIVRRGQTEFVRFKVHPIQRQTHTTVRCEAPLHEERWVRSSNGKRELRPVIRTTLFFCGDTWPIDITLTSRDMMGFRMLLGREATRSRYVIDPARSFLIKDLKPRS